jgi:methanogenic corrinoid protein MtbC1
MVKLEEIALNLQSGKAMVTSDLVTRAIEENYAIDTIVQHGLIAGIKAMEAKYRRHEIYMSEFRMASRAMDWGIRRIKSAIASSGIKPKGTVIIGSVEGDTEETDKNITAVMLEGRGFRVIDLGTGVTTEQFIEAAVEEKAALIACTAALVTTMAQMKTLVQAVKTAGLKDRVKIMIFGAPVTDRYCKLIGADMYVPDAITAAQMAEAMTKTV